MKKSVAIILTAVIVLTVAFTLTACKDNGEPVEGVNFIAHRGFSSEQLDNTAEAYSAAAEKGFYGIETDIRFTSDGYIVCSHDAGPLGHLLTPIVDHTLEELLALTLEKDGKKGKLCTFREYLEICKSGDKQAIVELKTELNEEQAASVIQAVDEYYSRDKVTFISFHIDALRLMCRLAPECSGQILFAENVLLARYLNGKYGETTFDVSASKAIMTRAKINKIHKMGLKVGVWTVNERSDAQKFAKYGADFITSNYYYGA